MFKILIIVTLVGIALADIDATITRFTSQVNYDGTYAFDVAQSNGAEFKESGVGGQYADGAFEYYSPEGEHVQVKYIADENGFRPETDRLPTPPPIPDYILRSIEYIRAHANPGELAEEQV